ncbi:MAG: hypothetical protein WBL70_05490 [Candidatus Acidiferrales bacterium]
MLTFIFARADQARDFNFFDNLNFLEKKKERFRRISTSQRADAPDTPEIPKPDPQCNAVQ